MRPSWPLLVLIVLLAGPAPPGGIGRPAWAQGIPEVRFRVSGFEVTGDNPLGPAETRRILQPFIGTHEGLERLQEAASALEKALREAGYAFHRVVLPAQTLKEGVVRLEVVSFRITSVRTEGAKHFSEENILASLPPLQVGRVPNTRELARAIRIANRHPSRRLTVGFSDDPDAPGIVARVKVEDERPWGLFAGLDNTGTAATGRLRLSLGARHTNLFGRDHQVTASYTTAPSRQEDVRQKAVSYTAPLYRLATLATAFWAQSDVDTGVVGGLEVSGAGQFLGLRLEHELLRWGPVAHRVSVALEDKLFESNALVVGGGGGSLFPNVRTRPVTLGYALTWELPLGVLDVSLDYARNLPFGGSNNGGAYRGNRAGADPVWDRWGLRASLDHGLPRGWLARAAFAAQWADEPLVPGEQFGVGGARSVRGFDERAVSGDSGARAGVELWTPPLQSTVNARLLAFIDWGHVSRRRPQVGEKANESIASVGLGLQMRSGRWSAVASVGRVVAGGAGRETGDVRAHLSTLWRY